MARPEKRRKVDSDDTPLNQVQIDARTTELHFNALGSNAAALHRVADASLTQPRGENQLLSKEQRYELLNSLRFDQMDSRRMTIKRAHANTCEWLLNNPEYLDWLDPSQLDKHHGLLWIKGKPGAGKSTLMNFALNNAHKTMEKTVIISFFFNARGDDLEKSAIGMYRSMLLQLLEQAPALQNVFNSLQCKPYQWTVESLRFLLRQAIRSLGKSSLACFVDALDECDEGQIRDMLSFFEQMGRQTTSAGIRFQMCFSSRNYPYITLTNGLTLVLEEQEGHNLDINHYLNDKLKVPQNQVAEEIYIDLQKRASGVFLWVVLVVEMLNMEHDGDHIYNLREKLRDIPEDVHKLFHGILTRARANKEQVLLCIQWVLFSRQPLKPEQLYFAILSGVEPEALHDWNPDNMTESTLRKFIINCSKGLVEITRSNKPTVQFIHESVKDFLLKENGLKEVWPDFGNNFQAESHNRLKHCCLNYISMDVYTKLEVHNSLPKASSKEATELRQQAEKGFPFLSYAISNIFYYANAAQGGGVSQMSFLTTFQLANWIKLANLLEKHQVRRHTENASFLYILAENDMGNLIQSHPSCLSCFEVEDERYGPPFFAALFTNSDEAMRTFLKTQAERKSPTSPIHNLYERYCQSRNKRPNFGPSFTFSRQRGILSHLAELGDQTMVEFYLVSSDKANIESEDKNGWTPLWWAAKNGHEDVIKLLLAAGANINIKDKHGQTLLGWATRDENKAIAKVLLQMDNTNVESRHYISRALIFHVDNKEHEAVIKLLLTAGADTNAKDEDGLTALSWAAKIGYEAAIHLLLAAGADVHVKDKNGWTPLWWAAMKGCEAIIIRTLLTAGADVDARDKDNRTPLLWAARIGYEAAAHLLLAAGADINAKDKHGWTPLWWATRKDHQAIVQLLLQTDKVDLGLEDKNSRTLLSWAAGDGNGPIVGLLLETGKIDADSRDDSGRTPLFYAVSIKGHYLLEDDPLVEDFIMQIVMLEEEGRKRMRTARQEQDYVARQEDDSCQDTQTTEQLIEKATANANTWLRRIVEMRAVKRDCETVIRLLLAAGVDVNAADKNSQTPLLLAAKNGNEAIIKLLQEKSRHFRDD
ncbi:Ankyrin repeat domain-containing protein 50 [Trichoderma lentiforme]|uniref:Ankyrin repeat domain-containing protein 50 n=1 Tax=Trichoderma lentiforme TaxID=1567552 RepID=A0A9P4XL22_9HYPO|nr:Ankyrin repeat domain-containing protein 50 [Trichoderma lentiforme]